VGEAVAAAQAGKLALESIIYAPELLKSDFGLALVRGQSASGLPCYPVTRQVFESVADKENPQGILAVARPQSYSLESLSPQSFPWGVGLVAPQDPGNVGTILRTIDAVGASGLLVLDSSVDPYHPSAVRASMGALFWYPLVRASFDEFARWAVQWGYTVYGTSAHGPATGT
jgi:TrmH family RNA methyltransferase